MNSTMLRRLSLSLLCAGPLAATAATTAIRAGTFLDVETGRELHDQVILVSDGRITAVGPQLAIPT